MRTIILLAVLTLLPATHSTQQGPPQSDRQSEVAKRGDHAMGFSHETTVHHFRLFKNGGEIVAETNDPNDLAGRDQIRTHLSHITKMFAAGNFAAPMFIHDTNPPGVSTMSELRDQIHYRFLETDRGATVRITTSSAQAKDAIHAFLLFQIVDHQTGDSPAIARKELRK
jgi:hypothetical protein